MVNTTPASAVASAEVVDAFCSELDEIESIFSRCTGARTVAGFVVPYAPTEDGCLISIWDAWNRFIRSFILTAAAGPLLGLSGTVYNPAVARTESQCLIWLNQNRRSKAYSLIAGEPKWTDARQLVDVMSTLDIDIRNRQSVVSAIGATTVTLGPVVVPSPLEEIRKCRNFVAHKAPMTLSDVRAYSRSSGPFISLSSHMRQKQGGVETFSVWAEALRAIAAAAGQ